MLRRERCVLHALRQDGQATARHCTRLTTEPANIDQRVTAFRERPEPGESGTVRPGTINAGVYLFDRRVLADVAPVCSLERDVMPALAARGALRGTVADGYFIDIGIPADLARAQTELPVRLKRRALLLPQELLIDAMMAAMAKWETLSRPPDAVAAIVPQQRQAGTCSC